MHSVRSIHSVTRHHKHITFSLSSPKQIKSHKYEEHDEDHHHLQTLTESDHHKILKSSPNSTAPNQKHHKNIKSLFNFTNIVRIYKKKKKLSEIPRNHHHQAPPSQFQRRIIINDDETHAITKDLRRRGKERSNSKSNQRRRRIRSSSEGEQLKNSRFLSFVSPPT